MPRSIITPMERMDISHSRNPQKYRVESMGVYSSLRVRQSTRLALRIAWLLVKFENNIDDGHHLHRLVVEQGGLVVPLRDRVQRRLGQQWVPLAPPQVSDL